MGPCAKQTVTCTLISLDGERFVGTNACMNPQAVCPREPGEGYEKCHSICAQLGHAEEQALHRAGSKAFGARAYVEGHTWCCQSCQIKLFEHGVEALTIGAPPYAGCGQ